MISRHLVFFPQDLIALSFKDSINAENVSVMLILNVFHATVGCFCVSCVFEYYLTVKLKLDRHYSLGRPSLFKYRKSLNQVQEAVPRPQSNGYLTIMVLKKGIRTQVQTVIRCRVSLTIFGVLFFWCM